MINSFHLTTEVAIWTIG